MIYTELTVKAMKTAYDAHHGQYDKSGVPYVFHPFHVAEQMEDELSVCVALLHDVVEDTDVEFSDLEKDFPQEIIDALKLLTHDKDEDYHKYVKALKINPVAVKVKLADIEHNMDESRIVGINGVTEEQKQHFREKYEKAKRILLK